MTDLRWEDVQQWFDPAGNGSAPDLVVTDTTLAGWQALISLIRTAGWRAEFEQHGRCGEVPASAADLFAADPDGWVKYLRVWPDQDIEVILRPWSADEMVGDVNLFELQGQERLDRFCGILRQIGRTLSRRVAMFAEGAGDHPPMLAYEVDVDRVVFLAGPWRG